MWWVSDYTVNTKFPFSTKLDAQTAQMMVPDHETEIWEWNPLAEDKDED